MFDGALTVQLGDELTKTNDSKLTVMCGFEQTIYLFFNYVSKITIVNQMITYHKAIYNLFGSGI